jgi:hypothetical protein
MIPKFKNTEQALAYGRLVGADVCKIEELKSYIQELKSSAYKFEHVEEYQKAIELLCQAQFVREALEEASLEKYKLKT